MLKKNAIIELDITDFDYAGYGVAHYEEFTVFVANALVGERIKALVLKISSRIAFAKVLEIIKYSPDRIKPVCPYYDKCGGCQMMHMNYELELKVKEKSIINTISKMLDNPKIAKIIPASDIHHYRNKISLPIGYDENGFITGFYQERSHHIIAANSCSIEQKESRRIINEVIGKLNDSNIYPYDEGSNTGDLRHLVMRANSADEFMLVFVFREKKPKVIDFVKDLKINNVKSIYININPNATNVIMGKEFVHISGSKYLTEYLFENKFLIHPNSFFQVNYWQMIKLYQTAISLLKPQKSDTIIDCYSGIGTISLTLARYCKKVYGIEVVAETVSNANQNKEINSIANAEFILGKCEDEIIKLVNREQINAIVMDPPRKGSDKKFLDVLIAAKIEKIVYISCGPSSLARDLKYLVDNGYEVIEIVPVDMFPRTNNIECVCLLTKVN